MRGVVCVLLLGACSYAPTPAGTSTPGDDGGPGGDDGGDAPLDQPVGRCGTPGAVLDQFSGTLGHWDVSGGTAAIANAQLRITNGVIRSRALVDLIGASADVEVVDPGNDARFELAFGAESVGIHTVGGQIFATSTSAAFPALPYTAADRFWQIAEDAGTLTFQTSADRMTWRTLATAPTPTFASAMRIVLRGANAAFDDVDRGAALATWCKAEQIVDSFDTATPAPFGLRWANSIQQTGCTLSISGGAGHANQGGGIAAECSLGSSASFDLRDSQVSTLITAITNFQNGWLTVLDVRDETGRVLAISFDNDQMCATGDGVTRTCANYQTDQEYWRLREAGGQLAFEISTDNATFTPIHTLATPFPVDAVQVHVGTVTEQAIGQSIGLSISDINP